MIKRTILWLLLLAAGFAPLAQAVPCIMSDEAQMSAGHDGCMTMHQAEKADCAKATVQDCFNLQAIPSEPTTLNLSATHDFSTPAILPAAITPVVLLGQNVVRPPPQAETRFTPTHEVLASLSRWLI